MESEESDPIEVSPLEFLNKKHFKFRGSIKVENVYIGSKISIQCKIYDGVVRTVQNERKRMTPANKLLEDE
jgi:ssDNA-binding replication factor A large subunit